MYIRDCLLTVFQNKNQNLWNATSSIQVQKKRINTSSCSRQDGVNGNSITRDLTHTLRRALLRVTKEMNHIKLWQSSKVKADRGWETTQINITFALLLFFTGHPLMASCGFSLVGERSAWSDLALAFLIF